MTRIHLFGLAIVAAACVCFAYLAKGDPLKLAPLLAGLGAHLHGMNREDWVPTLGVLFGLMGIALMGVVLREKADFSIKTQVYGLSGEHRVTLSRELVWCLLAIICAIIAFLCFYFSRAVINVQAPSSI